MTRFYYLCCLVIVLASPFPEEDHLSINSPTRENVDGRISGGMEAEVLDFEYQVQIVRENEPFCSGAIISERFILTAAHCVEDADPVDLVVRAGSLIRGEGVLLPIDKVVIHPEYDYPQNNFDIAILRTGSPIEFSRTLRPAFIADVGTFLPDQLRVSGWGYQGNDENKLSDVLRYVDLPIIHRMECQVYYPGISITKNMICGYSTRDMSKGTCKGDGGGPAAMELSRRLIGISSFARGCGPGMGPSVFTFLEAREVHDFIVNGTKIEETPTQQNPDEPTTDMPDLTSTEQPDEPTTDMPDPTSTEEPDEPIIDIPDSTSTEEPDEPIIDMLDLTSTEQPDEPTTDMPDATSTEQPDELTTVMPDSTSTEEPDEPIINLPDLTSTEQPDEANTDMLDPTSTEKRDEAIIDLLDLTSIEQPNEATIDMHDPTTTERPEELSMGLPEEHLIEEPEEPCIEEPLYGRFTKEKPEKLSKQKSKKHIIERPEETTKYKPAII